MRIRNGWTGHADEPYRAFTIRLPQSVYDKLQAKAIAGKRSIAAQVELELERKKK